ncbi:MAG: hypothetical protein AB7S78_07455 [Candidatus Omnitrophota bacterium]
MNKATVCLLSVCMCVGMASMAHSADDEVVQEMKALKALMDTLPDSTQEPSQDVYEESLEETVIEEDMDHADVEEAAEDLGTVEDRWKPVPSSDIDKMEEPWVEEDMATETVEEEEILTVPVQNTTREEETVEDVVKEESMPEEDMSPETIEEEGTLAVPFQNENLEETGEDVAMEEPEQNMDQSTQEESTILDLINTEAPQVDEAKDGVADAAVETDEMPDVASDDVIRFREDLSDEIATGISDINKRIKTMDSVLDQEINDLESEMNGMKLPEDREMMPALDREY